MRTTGPVASGTNVRVLGLSLFGLGLGEELWLSFMPAYLAALGAGGIVIGLYASARDLLDAAYQYPGGLLSDRIGRRRMLLACTALALCGYAIYAAAPAWPLVFAGLAAAMCWKAGAFPTTFAIIGDAMPTHRRARAFSLQSILVRVPRVVGAPLGGLLIGAFGILFGLRIAFVATVAIAAGVLVVQYLTLTEERPHSRERDSAVPRVPQTMSPALKRLLVADSVVRIGEGIAAPFIMLFLVETGTASVSLYGVLYAFQQSVAIASYVPGGRIADAAGRSPVIAMTFVCFALFPLAVRAISSPVGLILAFAVGGLKEIGEPARKALIVDLAPAHARAAAVGAYYTWRNLLVVPAGLFGGWLWGRVPQLPLEVGGGVAVIGLLLFFVMARRITPVTTA